MKAKVLHEAGERTFVVVFDTDDEVIQGLLGFARKWKVTAARFTAIGAFRRATLGYFDLERKEYRRIPIDEQVEVLTLAGDIAHKGGEPAVHAHAVVGKADGTAHGGHVLEAHVRPTLELMLVESPAHLVRVYDDATGLALIHV